MIHSKSIFTSLLAINISMIVLFIQGRLVKPGEDIVTCPTPWTKQLELHECARLNNPPADVQVLVPQICDYIILHGEKDSVDVIQIIEMGRLSFIFSLGLLKPYGSL